jgi:cytochrome c2
MLAPTIVQAVTIAPDFVAAQGKPAVRPSLRVSLLDRCKIFLVSADDSNRAGPTLAGIFGRRIATLPGYNFSAAFKKPDIVWTPETVSKLFEVGPTAYTPGAKMPEQRIGSAADRAALVDFLNKATR